MALSTAALELRSGRLTGTTTAAALGLHSYKSPLWAYKQILDIGETKVTDPMEWGTRLEPVIAAKFAEKRGITLTEMGTRQHPDYPFWAASGDFRIGPREALEVKTAGRIQKVDMWGRDDLDEDEYDNPYFDEMLAWGAEGSEDIPYEYIVQCAVQMAVFDLDAVWVAVLIGGNDYREYFRTRDLEFEEMLAEGACLFYQNHILPRIPPPPRDTAELLSFLKDLYPSDDGTAIEPTPEILESIERLRGYKAIAKDTKKLVDEETATIKAFLKESSQIGTGEKPLLTYKQARSSYPTDWAAVALATNPPAELVKSHTAEKPGSRRLLVK